MQAERLVLQVPPENIAEGSEPIMSSPESSAGLRLKIQLTSDKDKIISFNSQSNLLYRIEESSDLLNWNLLEEVVAIDTNTYFYAFDDAIRFYRVIQNDERIQFPDWDDFVEQYLYFDVWTPITGTYHLELYGDGALLHSTTEPVPADGFFGVYDGNYNPAHWPFTGYYPYDTFELRVTVTPAGGAGGAGGAAAQATVKKKQRRRNDNRVGTTVQLYNAFTVSMVVQDQIDDWMHNYFLSCLQSSFQVDLDGGMLDEFVDTDAVPRIHNANDWGKLKNLIYGPTSFTWITDLHYFGHGANSRIGGNGGSLTLTDLKSALVSTNPMRYVALDGCKTGQNIDYLKAFVGHGKQTSWQKFRDKGWDPVFAWGWKDNKSVAFERQGQLYDEHFWFVGDYYWFLTQRDISGYLFHTYQESIEFGKRPNGNSPLHPRTRNTEGDSITYVGCFDCVFDLP